MKKERCNCGASCGENRYHNKGVSGCKYEETISYVLISSDIGVYLQNIKTQEKIPMKNYNIIIDSKDDGRIYMSVRMNDTKIKLCGAVFK